MPSVIGQVWSNAIGGYYISVHLNLQEHAAYLKEASTLVPKDQSQDAPFSIEVPNSTHGQLLRMKTIAPYVSSPCRPSPQRTLISSGHRQ